MSLAVVVVGVPPLERTVALYFSYLGVLVVCTERTFFLERATVYVNRCCYSGQPFFSSCRDKYIHRTLLP